MAGVSEAQQRTPGYYPPVGFHFKVEVLGLTANANDVRFSEVSGLSVEMGTEEVAEGGVNHFVQKYPTRSRYSELVLKRGLLLHTEIGNWVRQCIEDLEITPKNVDITLLNDEHQPLMTWHVTGAYPTRWAVSDLSASTNAVVIETLQLCYQHFRVKRS